MSHHSEASPVLRDGLVPIGEAVQRWTVVLAGCVLDAHARGDVPVEDVLRAFDLCATVGADTTGISL